MSSHTEMGNNRTGMATSPTDGASLVQATRKTVPSKRGDATAIADRRIAASAEGSTIGTMPPPASMKGAAKSFLKAVRGMNVNVFLDKLAERLAFERTGTRLYDGLLSKYDAYGTWPGGPTREDLQQHRMEELAHFELVRQALLQMGADPTVMTPSADLAAVASSGIVLVVADPRTTLLECLEVVQTAELADNDAWEMLVELARDLGQEQLAGEFALALTQERRHLAHIRRWVSGRLGMLLAGQPSKPPRGLGARSNGALATAPSKAKAKARSKSKKATKSSNGKGRTRHRTSKKKNGRSR